MPTRQGIAIWPGVQSVVSCTYTCSHGTQPGTAVLVCHPQTTQIKMHGTLTITDGFGRVSLPACKINAIYGPQGEGEKTWTIEIVDRRWRWRDLGVLNGLYNQRDPRGRILVWSLRSIPDLIALCLSAMGEVNYTLNLPTVSTSTEEIYPAINWDAVNPAYALTQLCERIGCRVVYRIGSNSVLITPVGVGGNLPAGPLAREGPSVLAPDAPDRIDLYGAPVRFQAQFALAAVGKEWDGSYRPIDFLSYAPKTQFAPKGSKPWDYSAPGVFPDVQATTRLSYRQARALAQESVFRCYQLINLDPYARVLVQTKPLRIPGFGVIQRIQQVIPQETQVEQLTPQPADETRVGPDGRPLDKPFYDGYSRDKPAQVFGSYFYSATGIRVLTEGANTDPDKEVTVPFRIDQENMLVIFDQPVYVVEDAGARPAGGIGGATAKQLQRYREATLVLQTGCQVRDPINNQVVRFYAQSPLSASPSATPPALVLHEDCQLNYIGVYDSVTHQLTNVLSDIQRASVMAGYYLAREAAKYDLKGGLERVYRGIVAVDLDGAIQQVTWSIGGGQPAMTRASRQFEHSAYIPTFPERLKIQYLGPAQRRKLDLAASPDNLGAGESLWKDKPR